MRTLILVICIASGLFANVCEANKQKFKDRIMWSFVASYVNKNSLVDL